MRMERVTIGDLKPDLTVILDVPVEVGMQRAAARRGSAAPDRFEARISPSTRNSVTLIARSPQAIRSGAC